MANSGKRRQSKHSRSRNPSLLILQCRDIEILKSVFRYRYLSRSQIQRLFNMNSITRINIRLRKLFDNRYLDRYFQPTLFGSSEAIYSIGLNGLPVISESLGLDIIDAKRRRKLNNVAKDKFISHNLAVNDFRINLMNDLNRHKGFEFIKWLDARDCEFKFKYRQLNKEINTSIKPDGYFEFIYQNCLYSFFLEVDLSTSNHTKLESKFRNYLVFKKLNLFRQEFNKEVFYVLVITKNDARAENLCETANQLESSIFWFTTMQRTTDNILYGNIWKRSDCQHARAFFSKPIVRIVN